MLQYDLDSIERSTKHCQQIIIRNAKRIDFISYFKSKKILFLPVTGKKLQ